MADVINQPTVDDSLEGVIVDAHGMRHVSMSHVDFRRRFLDKYGRCTNLATDIRAVECTCKATANRTDEITDVIAIVYGINIVKFNEVTELTVDTVNNCYMDAALDATKRLSTCIDIYYKNKDNNCANGDNGGDGEDGKDKVTITFDQKTSLEYNRENDLSAIVFSGNVLSNLDVTITPKNCTLKNFASDTEEVVNSDMVYELQVHTLDAINTELASLKCTPIALADVAIEIRVNGVLTKTLSLLVRDNSFLEATMTPSSVIVNKEGVINPIVFTGELNKSIEVVVAPKKCSVSGFTSRPDTVVNDGSTWSFNADSVEAINNELASLKVVATTEGECQIEVRYMNDFTVFTIEVLPATANVNLSFNLPKTSVVIGKKIPIPAITATGTIDENVTINVIPQYCAVSGFASDPDKVYCGNATYSFVASDLNTINTELASLVVLGAMLGTATLTIKYLDQTTTLNIEVIADTVNNVVPVLDTSTKLMLNKEVSITPLKFIGKVVKDSVEAIVTPTNCTFKGVTDNAETVYDSNTPARVSKSTLEELNTAFNALKVTATAESDISLNVKIDNDTDEGYTFNFTVAKPSNITVTCSNTTDSIQAQVAHDIAIVVSGTLSEDDPKTLTITPANCKFNNVNDEPTEYTDSSPLELAIDTIENVNGKLDNVKLTALNTTGVALSVAINGVEAPTVLNFNTVSAAPVSSVTNVTSSTPTLNEGVAATGVALTAEGNIYSWNKLTLTLTPKNCTVTNITGDDTSGTYNDSTPYVVELDSVDTLNSKLANLTVTPTGLSDVQIVAEFSDSKSHTVDFTVTPKLTIQLAEYTAKNYGEFTDATAMTLGGHLLSVEESYPEVTLTPTNCVFKGITGDDSTEYTNESPYKYTATNITDLNAKLATLQILAFDTDPTIKVTVGDDTAQVSINATPKEHELTVSCDNLADALTVNTPSAAMAVKFAGTFISHRPVSVTITPTNCTFNGVTGDTETVYNNGSPLTIEASNNIEELNNKVNAIKVTATANSDVKLTVTILETPTELTFTNVTA